MSDKEIILQLLKKVEWRIRANRLLHELAFGLSIVLTFLIALKVWDLFSPLQGLTVTSLVVASLLLFAGFASWAIRRRGTLDQAAASIDRQAGLQNEIGTAFWFINHPRSSDWIDQQLQRAARNARNINLSRAYPNSFPRTSYVAVAAILLFVGLNFIPASFNHNWLALEASPANPDQNQEGLLDTSAQAEPGDADRKAVQKGLEEIAEQLKESELLDDVAEALEDGDLQRAADLLRSLEEQLGKASREEADKFREALAAAAADRKAGLDTVQEEFLEISDALDDSDDLLVDEQLDEAAQQIEQLASKLQDQPAGAGYQSDQASSQASDTEPTEQIAASGQTPQKRSNTNGPGTSKTTPGGLAKLPTSLEGKLELDVKLQADLLKGLEGDKPKTPPEDEDEISEASKHERSKVDYRAVKSELSPAQKELLNQDQVPWEYRALIKSYFQAIRPTTNPSTQEK
jgi:hypothetical protein